MKKTERLYMRIDKNTKDKIEKIAKQENRSMSNWIESVILEKLQGENKMKEYTSRIYKDIDNHLTLSYKGIDKSEYENITHEEFIEIVENSNAWNDIDAEIYESALEDVGLDYSQYEDPDLMWEDYLEAVRG